MNNLRLLKIKKFILPKTDCLTPNLNSLFNQRFCSSLMQKRKKIMLHSVVSAKNFLVNSAFLSGCSFKNCEDKVHDSHKDENFQEAVENEDFQNILKDFAKDFEVGDESQAILEDIRKDISERRETFSHKEISKENNVSSEKFYLYHNLSKEKYTDFKESDSSSIFSYEDLQSTEHDNNEILYHVTQKYDYNLDEQKLQRGVHGVFDIEELVQVLRNERVSDIAVISMPKEFHYTDFLVLVTAKSPRHSQSVTEFINKLYKKKKNVKDPFIIIEGEKVNDWKAMDLGNIVLHVFLQETRALYDIESLWLLDSNYDTGGNVQSDPMISVIEEQMSFFASLQNAQTSPNKDVD